MNQQKAEDATGKKSRLNDINSKLKNLTNETNNPAQNPKHNEQDKSSSIHVDFDFMYSLGGLRI